jgi:hypothetical protein
MLMKGHDLVVIRVHRAVYLPVSGFRRKKIVEWVSSNHSRERWNEDLRCKKTSTHRSASIPYRK